MRSFRDAQGNHWDAALLSASYGNIMLIFSPEQGDDVRQQLMSAENRMEAEAQLAGFEEYELRAMLAEAQPWDPDSLGF